MTRQEFTGVFLGMMIKKIPMWLPEEATEEEMLNVMQLRMKEHNSEIRKVLCKNNVSPEIKSIVAQNLMLIFLIVFLFSGCCKIVQVINPKVDIKKWSVRDVERP